MHTYGVTTVSRIDKIIGLFCRISSLLQGFFAEETYNFIDPTDRSHPIFSQIIAQTSKYPDSKSQCTHICVNKCTHIRVHSNFESCLPLFKIATHTYVYTRGLSLSLSLPFEDRDAHICIHTRALSLSLSPF